MKKLITILIILILLAGGAYVWFLMRTPSATTPGTETSNSPFNPFNRGTVQNTNTEPTPTSSGITSQPASDIPGELPRLRHLSSTPVGGFMASTTASSTLVRYVDRGVGHVFEAQTISNTIDKISNTTIPRVYESFWNKNLSAVVLRYMKDNSEIVNFYAELRKVPVTASSTPEIPYEIKGKFLDSALQEIAVSPKGDRIFTINLEGGKGTGYISGFDESKKTKVLETPLTQVLIDWPEENTLTLSTKPSGYSVGYFYAFDLKKPVLKRIVGSITGLTAKMSPDAKKVIYSSGNSRGFTTSIFNIRDNATQDVVFRTLTDKCVWSKLHPTEVYCAVPTEIPQALYPDDWYKGKVSFVDQIWHLDTVTGEVTLIANPLTLANELVDAINLALDPKENFLYFVNKKDLTLWSLDLNE